MKIAPFSMLSYKFGMLAAFSLLGSAAHGAVTVSFSDSPSGLIAEWFGTLDVTSLTPSGDVLSDSIAVIRPGVFIVAGDGDDLYDFDFGTQIISGSFSQQTVELTSAQAQNTDSFGFFVDSNSNSFFYVPDGFTSGSLNGEVTVPNITLSDLQLDVGTYPWGTVTANSITFEPVPEPSSTLLIGLSGMFLASRRRR